MPRKIWLLAKRLLERSDNSGEMLVPAGPVGAVFVEGAAERGLARAAVVLAILRRQAMDKVGCDQPPHCGSQDGV